MSLSADPRYRSVHLTWRNYDAAGSETVRWWAKPSGGAWSIVQMMPVAAAEQAADWDTALPLTAYDIALQFVNGTVPTAGYEGEPDAWTAATAALSKGTVTTTCASVTGLAGTFVSAATPLALSWVCAQTGITFLLEKNIGAGWVTVASGLTAQSYQYTIPGAELATTVQFRVTPQVGAVSGTPSDTVSVLMAIAIGTPTWVSGTFTAATASVALSWSAASNATSYLVEKSKDGGATWSTLVSQAGITYSYAIDSTEVNRSMKYRVTGQQGAYSGAVSTTQTVATTVALTKPTITAAQVIVVPGVSTGLNVTFTEGTGPVYSYWGLIPTEVILASALAPTTSFGGSRGDQWATPGSTVNVVVRALSFNQLVTVDSDPFPVVVT